MSLNDKQEAFCQEYCSNGYNALKAYIKAYPDSSHNAAKANSHRLIDNDRIRDRIDEIKAKISEKWELSKDYVIKGLYNIAEDKTTQKAVKVRAYENLGRICGAFELDNEQKREDKELTELQKRDIDDFIAWKQRKMLKPAS
ncbi:MAG: terminase small subunit [Candidatus Omnitrophota bacterium]|nr:MAG: terminase small subunit [Candidatus Omnitrophota bacterium]